MHLSLVVEEVYNCNGFTVEFRKVGVLVANHHVSLDAEHVDEAAFAEQVLRLLWVRCVRFGVQSDSLGRYVVLARESEQNWLVGRVRFMVVEGVLKSNLEVLRATHIVFKMNEQRSTFKVAFSRLFLICVVFKLLQPVRFHLDTAPELEQARHVVLDSANFIHYFFTSLNLIAFKLVEFCLICYFVQGARKWTKKFEQIHIKSATSLI